MVWSTCNRVGSWLLTLGIMAAGNRKIYSEVREQGISRAASVSVVMSWDVQVETTEKFGECSGRRAIFTYEWRRKGGSWAQDLEGNLWGSGIKGKLWKYWNVECIPLCHLWGPARPRPWGCAAVVLCICTRVPARLCVRARYFPSLEHFPMDYSKFFSKTVLDNQVLILMVCQLHNFKIGFLTALKQK